MKTLALTLAIVGFAAASALAGNGSCGDKKEGKKDGTKENQSLSVQL